MKTKLSLSALVLGLASITCVNAAAPVWDFIEAGYAQADIDDSDGFEPAGLTLAGSKLLNENVFIEGSYSMLSDDYLGVDVDFDQGSLALGYRHPLNSTTDVYGTVSYEFVEVSGAGASADDNGYGLTVGVRSRLTSEFEVDASIGYIDIDDESDTSFGVGANYYFNQNFAAGLNYTLADDYSILGATVRYAF